MKRKQFLLLCIVLLASVTVKAEDLAYTTNNDGTLTITGFASGFTPPADYTLVIPDEIDGKAVTAIKASAFKGKTNFTSLTIGSNVKTIGDQVFMNCTKLTGSVVIPNSVTSLGTSIFEGCSNLTAASFEDGYTLDYIPKWLVWGTNITTFVIPPSVKYIHQGAFKNCKNMTSIEIPATVTTINKEAFMNCTSLTEITIPSSITSMEENVFNGSGVVTANIACETLGQSAFNGCSKLTTVNLLNGVKTIKSSAFSGCSKLTTVSIPASVTTMESSAFYGCSLLSTVSFAEGIQLETIPESAFSNSGLTSITIPASVKTIGSYAFQECNKLTNVIFPENTQLTTINNYAFRSCALLPSFTMPNSLTTLGSGVFYSCPKLASVTFSNQLTTIPNETFYDCSSLNNVTIPSWIKTIGDRVFMNCTALTSNVVIPNSVTAIGTSMFEGCSNLTTVSFEEGYKLDYIPKWYVWGTSITSFVIPPSVKEIRQGAFKNCTKMTSIEIPGNVTTLGGEAFMNCSLLTEVTIPATITSMDSNVFKESGIITANIACETLGSTAFYNCKKLTTVNFLDGVKTIKSGAFSSCTNLSIVSIPASVTTMEASAFWGCSSLSTVNFANGIQLETISETAFYGTALTSITIPASVKTIGGSAFYSCKKLTEVLFPENSQLTTIGSSAFSNCTLLPSFTMPNTLTTMGSSVFNSCSSLVTITFSEQLTSIPNETFYDCSSLNNVTIPSWIKTIGDRVFMNCTALTSNVVIPNSVTAIGTSMFEGCSNLTTVSFEEGYKLDYIPKWYVWGTSITSFVIPPSVKEIRQGAFKNCTKLESITIPSNITTLGKEAFMNCTKLTNIVLPNSIGTMESDIFKGCNTLQTIDASQCVNVYDWYINNSIRSGIFNGVPTTTKIILPPNSLMTSLGTNDEITPFEFNLQQDEEGYYLIGDADDWDQFVIHSRTNPEINARLTADIDLTGHVGKVGVGYNSSNCKYYMGTFDGQYHKITINDQLNKDYAGGLFYGVKDATIQRLIVDGTIKTSFLHTGGIIGIFNNLTMNDCESRLKITGITTAPQNLYIGGFLGHGEWDIPASFTDCLFSGVIDGGSNVQYCSPFLGFTGRSKYVTYSYCLNNGTFDVDPSSLHVMGDGVYPQPVSSFYIAGNYSSDYVYGTSVSAYQLAQGEIAYNLQGDRTEQHWGQVIGTDPAPVLTNDPNKWVYKINEYKYSNNPNDSGILTGISHAEQSSMAEGQNDEWFTPEGQKLNGRPTAKGIYIRNGRKVILK